MEKVGIFSKQGEGGSAHSHFPIATVQPNSCGLNGQEKNIKIRPKFPNWGWGGHLGKFPLHPVFLMGRCPFIVRVLKKKKKCYQVKKMGFPCFLLNWLEQVLCSLCEWTGVSVSFRAATSLVLHDWVTVSAFFSRNTFWLKIKGSLFAPKWMNFWKISKRPLMISNYLIFSVKRGTPLHSDFTL